METPQWVLNRINEFQEKNPGYLDLTPRINDEPLRDFPKIVLQMNNLKYLNLSSNKLQTLPNEIEKLENLDRLILYDNQLTVLPKTIAHLKNLRHLEMGHNLFEYFPEVITELTNLISLAVNENSLAYIPESIGQLQNLKTLSLSHNLLINLPNNIARLINLSDLYLSDNPLIKPPPEVIAKGIGDIIGYFRQISVEGQDYLYEAKLVVLGEGGAGKSTLANKIINPNYQLREEESTQGIDVSQWEFQLERDKSFRVNIWDFGGQAIYHATHQFFLTKRSLYLLVADTRKEDTDFYYWLNAVELFSDNSPLIIIKNEKQDRHREINERQLRGQFDNLKIVLSSNLATNRGLDGVVDEIKHYIKNLPHIGSPLPKTWIRVREKLENDPRNYIDLDEYLSICSENGFVDIQSSLQLSGYLHDLGVFLHFQDDPLLRRMVILKPKWGTDAVYKVLDNKDVIRNLGRFTITNLKDIWNSPEYTNMYYELLQLMMKFRLCYQIPNLRETYIAPQLLSENQPSYSWKDTDNLLLRYTYEFMPKGILTQFIVIMHRYIAIVNDQSFVWRSGVIVAKGQTAAEVIEHYGKREIQVRIRGPHKKDVMAVIMDRLDEIHSSYKRLRYSKLIPCNCTICHTNSEPYFHRFEQLQNFMENQVEEIQCGKSGDMVNVHRLVDDTIGWKSKKEVEALMAEAEQKGKQQGQPNIQVGSVTIGGNAKVEGFNLGGIIQNSFNKADSANIADELKETLKQLAQAVDTMSKELSEMQAAEVADDFEKLVDETTKPSPNKKWYSVSINGLTKAAENIGKVGEPVVKLATKVLALLA